MHPDSYVTRYRPTSPLSPRLPTSRLSLSPSPSSHRTRASYSKQSPRMFQLDLPTYMSAAARGQITSPPSNLQSPAITLNRGTQLTPMESPRLMREKQKELIAKAQLSSKLAASPLSAKPDAPRLDPLGSPKGPVTPLTLEQEAVDYFSMASTGRLPPAASPSSRNSLISGNEDKTKKKHRYELYR